MATLDVRDYPQGVEAARRVMLELWSILGAYRDTLTLVGGARRLSCWVRCLTIRTSARSTWI